MKRRYIFLGTLVILIFALISLKGTFYRYRLATEQLVDEPHGFNQGQQKNVVMTQREKIMNYVQTGEGDPQTLIKLAEAYIAETANDVEVILILANGYLQIGDLAKAKNSVEQAITLNPNNGMAFRILAQIYREEAQTSNKSEELKEKLFKAAYDEIEKALNLDPENPWINVEAALIYQGVMNNDKAIAAIEKAYKALPDDENIKSLRDEVISK